jgi:hypothetical protein
MADCDSNIVEEYLPPTAQVIQYIEGDWWRGYRRGHPIALRTLLLPTSAVRRVYGGDH